MKEPAKDLLEALKYLDRGDGPWRLASGKWSWAIDFDGKLYADKNKSDHIDNGTFKKLVRRGWVKTYADEGQPYMADVTAAGRAALQSQEPSP